MHRLASRSLAPTLVALLLPAVLLASPVVNRYVGEPADERVLRRSVRHLPAPAEVWRCDCRPRASAVAEGAVHVAGRHRLFALDAEDKVVLWDRKQDEPFAAAGGVLVLEDRVAAVFGDELLLHDRATGVEVARTALGGGRLEALVGPPLTALVAGPEAGEWRLVRIDPAGGAAIAQIPLAGPTRLAAVAGRLYVLQHEDSAPALLHLDPETLAPLARWPLANGVTSLQVHGGTLYAFSNAYEGFGYVDLPVGPGADQGERGAGEPIAVGGSGRTLPSGDLGFALAAPGWDGKPRELIRYDPADGSELWRTAFACAPGPRLIEGDRIVHACGWREAGDGLIYLLDAASGEVREVLRGPAGVRSIARAGGHWIVTTDEGVVALDPERREPPVAGSEPAAGAVDRILRGIRQPTPLVWPADVERLLDLGPAAWPAMAARLPEVELPAALTLAEALGEARYRPAAAAVAGRLLALPPLDRRDHWRKEARFHPPEVTLLHALGRLGGAQEAAAVATVLLDPEQPWRVRQEAAFALAGIGDPKVFLWLDWLDGADAAHGAGEPPADLESAQRRAVREHLARFGERDGPRPLCPPGADPEAPGGGCLAFEVRRLEDEEGAAEAAAALEVGPDERMVVVAYEGGPYTRKSFFLLKPISDRWAVRDVWPWVS